MRQQPSFSALQNPLSQGKVLQHFPLFLFINLVNHKQSNTFKHLASINLHEVLFFCWPSDTATLNFAKAFLMSCQETDL